MRERTKKTIFNRLTAYLLSLALVLCHLPIVPVQAEIVTDETGWQYEVLDNGTAVIKGYTGTDTQIVVPTQIAGYPVSRVGNSAFEYNSNITSVVISEGIGEISSWAFLGCSSLKNVTLGSVSSIRTAAFAGCSSLTTINLENVTFIGESSFENCKALGTVNLQNLVSAEKEAFLNCGLREVTLGSLSQLAEGMFENCSMLTSINLENVCSIGRSAFNNCTALKSVTFSDNLINIEEAAFKNCGSLDNVVLPNGVTTIGKSAFEECKALTKIKLPEGLKVISERAFFACESIASVTIPDSVATIESFAFEGCSGLENVVLPEKLTTIAKYTFAGCSGLKSIVIPDKITTIESYAFTGCNGLKSLILPEGLVSLGTETFNYCTGLTDIVLPSTLNSFSIGNWNSSFGDPDSNSQMIFYCVENSPAHTILVDAKINYNFYYTIVPGETTALTVPTKPGYEFQGWYTQKTGGDLITDVTAFTEETVVYARWKKILSETDMSFTLSEDTYTYNGMANVPEVTMKYGSTTMVKDKDYTVKIENNTNAGTATVTVTGIGGYTGTLTKTFTINTQSINRAEVTIAPYSYTYDGTEKVPAVKVIVNGRLLEKDTDYTIDYLNTVNAGYPSIALVGIGNYTGNYNTNYEIKTKSIEDATLTLSQTVYAYDGLEKEPEVTLKIGEVTLVKDKDYEVRYYDNASAGMASVNVNGIGNYTGSLEREYEIIDYTIHNTQIIVNDLGYVYDGTEKFPEVKVGFKQAYLVKDVDYTVTYANNVNAGTATLTVTGIGTWKDSVSKTFSITAADLSDATVTLSQSEYVYDGTVKSPDVSVVLGTTTLVEDVDFEVYYDNRSDAGVATVVVSGIGNFYGSVEKNYQIKAATLEGFTINMASTNYIFDGSEKAPVISVGILTPENTFENVLEKGKDYTVSYSNHVNIGTAKVIVTGIGNYSGTLTKEFTIQPVDIATTEIEVLDSDCMYDGKEKLPEVIVTHKDILLIKDVDYTLTYAENVNPGTAKVTVTGKGNFTGSKVSEFVIKTIKLNDATLKVQPLEYVYDGTEKQPEVIVTFGEKVLVKGTDYTVSYTAAVNAGTAIVTVTGMGMYSGEISATYEIHAASLGTANVVLDAATYIYDGKLKTPELMVVLGDTTLVKDIDYKVTYSDNLNVGTATISVEGIGNYADVLTKEFAIAPIDVAHTVVALTPSEFVCDGTEKTPEVLVTYNGAILVKDVDYTFACANNVNAGTATVTVSGKGNYTGTQSKTYVIQAASLATAVVTLDTTVYVYDGTEKTPDVTVVLGAKTLVKDVDYTIAYGNNKNAGTATVMVTGIGNYTDCVTSEFSIQSVGVETAVLNVDPTEFVYDGTEKKPVVTLTVGETMLIEEIDYEVAFADVLEAGTATVTVTGKGNYTGTQSKNFEIQAASLALADLTLETSSYVYDGIAKTPVVTVVIGNKTLVKDVDYSVEYTNNQNAGTANVTISGIGNYTGSISKEFSILGIDVSDAQIRTVPSKIVYDGTEKKPTVTVKINDTALVEGKDFTVAYSNNTNAGTAMVTVTGIGNYTGSQNKEFTIQPATIRGAKLTLDTTSYVHDGKEKKPEVSVLLFGKTLKKDVDYSVSYSNNKNPGNAKVTITGKGNYTDSMYQVYLINVSKVQNLKQSTQYSTSKITLTWSKVSGATGYAVYYSSTKNGTYKYARSVNTNTYTNSSLKSAMKRYYKVVAYVTVDGKNIYGEYSDAKCMLTKPGTPTGFTVKLSSKIAKINWSKVNGVDGYEIYMAESRTGKYTTIKSASAGTVSYNKTGLKSGKKYYFKMRSYVKTETGAKVYSGYSKIKAVTVK